MVIALLVPASLCASLVLFVSARLTFRPRKILGEP
jgi:hypothetical protein